MKNITFEGISTLQRLHLCWQIRKQIGKIHQPIKVEFHQPICRKQYSSLWYGGLVVSIKVRGCVFAIHACGDIYATLYDKSDGTELLYVKDKSNSGRFGVDVLPYLKTDHALYAAMGDTHKRYRLDMEHNNWWECFVYTPEGEFHDMMWALDMAFNSGSTELYSLPASISSRSLARGIRSSTSPAGAEQPGHL